MKLYYEFRDDRCNKGLTLLRGVNQFLAILPACISDLHENQNKILQIVLLISWRRREDHIFLPGVNEVTLRATLKQLTLWQLKNALIKSVHYLMQFKIFRLVIRMAALTCI